MHIDTGLLIVGHLVGDYLLQSEHMAVNKKRPGAFGASICVQHCMFYAAAVALIAGMGLSTQCKVSLFMVAFWTHFPIDRTNIVERLMEWSGQTTFNTLHEIEDLIVREARKQFIPIVYVGADNSLHLLLMVLLTRMIEI